MKTLLEKVNCLEVGIRAVREGEGPGVPSGLELSVPRPRDMGKGLTTGHRGKAATTHHQPGARARAEDALRTHANVYMVQEPGRL